LTVAVEATDHFGLMVMLPLAVPGMVMAFGYLATALQLKTFFQAHNAIYLRDLFDVQNNPTLVLIIAYAMRRLPYVVRSAVAGLQQTPIDLELAAKNLGASGMTTMCKITVPLISANLIAGGLLAFAFAMLEVSDSLVLAQRESHWPRSSNCCREIRRAGCRWRQCRRPSPPPETRLAAACRQTSRSQRPDRANRSRCA
jgi:iron(III) transport system permease protein